MPVAPLLAPFLGTWRGSGSGSFPTMEPFDFEEEIRFLDVGSRDLAYLQRAWRANTDEVLHAEAGMWRATDEGQLTAMIAQPRVGAQRGQERLLQAIVGLDGTDARHQEPMQLRGVIVDQRLEWGQSHTG